MSWSEERKRVLQMIEAGQVTAEEGARLLDTLGEGPRRERPRASGRALRVRVTDLQSHRHKVNVTIPVNLVEVGLKLGSRLAPRMSRASIESILNAAEQGTTGRVFEMQDLEEGERIEIFVE